MSDVIDCCCWNCSAFYALRVPKCPKCRAINPNVDFDGAKAQMTQLENEVGYVQEDDGA